MSNANGELQKSQKLSMSIPRNKAHLEILERLRRVAKQNDRSVNYVAVEAIHQYLEREEGEA